MRKKVRKAQHHEAATTGTGAGDDAWMLGALCISTSAPLSLLETLLPSLPFSFSFSFSFSFPFSLFSLLLPSADGAAESSALDSGTVRGGAVQRGISQTTPVKLLSLKPPLAHLRQGLPDRSRARRPALMAPWFALGPSLWADGRPVVPLWSIVPSSSRGFFLGPGLPLGLGMPSLLVPFTAVADRLTPFFVVGGGIGVEEGVPSAAGVAAFESEAASAFEGAADAASALGLAGDSLGSELALELLDAGDWEPSLIDSEEGKMSRSRAGGTLRVTSRPCLVADLRRASAALAAGAIASGRR